MWWYHGGGGAWLVMSLWMIVFWALVIWAFINLARSTGHAPPPGERTPEEILAERLARGDIDENEYRQRLEALRSTSTGLNDRAGAS